MKKIILASLDILYPLFKRFMSKSVYQYLALGAVNTVLNVFLFILFYQFILSSKEYRIFGFSIESYTLSLLYSFLITLPTGYWFAKHFAFSETSGDQATAKTFSKYFIVVVQGLVSDYLLLKFLIEIAHLNPSLAKTLSTLIVLTVNYLLQKHFTFKSKEAL